MRKFFLIFALIVTTSPHFQGTSRPNLYGGYTLRSPSGRIYGESHNDLRGGFSTWKGKQYQGYQRGGAGVQHRSKGK